MKLNAQKWHMKLSRWWWNSIKNFRLLLLSSRICLYGAQRHVPFHSIFVFICVSNLVFFLFITFIVRFRSNHHCPPLLWICFVYKWPVVFYSEFDRLLRVQLKNDFIRCVRFNLVATQNGHSSLDLLLLDNLQ